MFAPLMYGLVLVVFLAVVGVILNQPGKRQKLWLWNKHHLVVLIEADKYGSKPFTLASPDGGITWYRWVNLLDFHLVDNPDHYLQQLEGWMDLKALITKKPLDPTALTGREKYYMRKCHIYVDSPRTMPNTGEYYIA